MAHQSAAGAAPAATASAHNRHGPDPVDVLRAGRAILLAQCKVLCEALLRPVHDPLPLPTPAGYHQRWLSTIRVVGDAGATALAGELGRLYALHGTATGRLARGANPWLSAHVVERMRRVLADSLWLSTAHVAAALDTLAEGMAAAAVRPRRLHRKTRRG